MAGDDTKRADATKRDDGTELPEETVLIQGVNPRTREVTVLRTGGESLEAAVLAPAVEGRPLTGDLVRLTPMPGFPRVASLKTLMRHPDAEAPGAGRGHKGPPRVTSEAYRRGWEAIFGRGGPPDEDADVN